ncbi:MAG: metallophosphoesterase family protein [Chloroflexota bacterium]
MRLLHFADLHLGIDLYGRIDPESGLSTRVLDFLRAFDQIVDAALEQKVDAVLFAGDAFKHRDPNPTLQREFARRIVRLRNAGIPIVLLMGNHDLPGIESRAAAAEIYHVLEIEGVHVAREIESRVIQTASGPLQVVSLPWITRSRLMTSPAFRQFSDADQRDRIVEGVRYAMHQCVADLDTDLPRVLLAHITMQGAEYGHERSIMLGNDISVDGQTLRVTEFDYVALGHIHKHQALRSHPPVVYSGSPERVDFGEESEQKGFVIVDLEQVDGAWRASWTFHPLDVRPFLTIRIDARGSEVWNEVKRAIDRERQRIRGAVVRCFVNLEAGLGAEISGRDVRAMIEEHNPYFIGQVVVQAGPTQRGRFHVATEEALDAEQMLERWLEMRDFDRELSDHIRKLGNDLIKEQRERSMSAG